MLANNVDPDQMPYYVASDLGLHCLPMTKVRIGKDIWEQLYVFRPFLQRETTSVILFASLDD